MRITVYLDADIVQPLLASAQRDRRRPSDQAAVLIERALAQDQYQRQFGPLPTQPDAGLAVSR